MGTVRLARKAMACRFEIILEGNDEPWLRAAGEEALREIERLEAQLSIFRGDSVISQVNRRAAFEPVCVDARTFQLLETSRRLHERTNGAFDPTVAPLMQVWGFYGDEGRMPDDDELERVRTRTGMHLVELDPDRRSVRFKRDGVRLDFGAIGKGLAVDEAVYALRQAGVKRAFLHGGSSTMYGLGRPADGSNWTVGIADPGDPDEIMARVSLEDESLSVSAVWGKAFEADGEQLGHVLDPRLGRPVRGAVLAAVACSSATEADAVSTALLVNAGPLPGLSIRSLIVRHETLQDTYTVLDDGLSRPVAPHHTTEHLLSPRT